jgi:hypothetical protein
MRSANRGNSYNTWYVNSSGNVNNNNANNSMRCAPDCVIQLVTRQPCKSCALYLNAQGAEYPAARLNNAEAIQTACELRVIHVAELKK